MNYPAASYGVSRGGLMADLTERSYVDECVEFARAHQPLDHKDCAVLAAENERLKARIAELEASVAHCFTTEGEDDVLPEGQDARELILKLGRDRIKLEAERDDWRDGFHQECKRRDEDCGTITNFHFALTRCLDELHWLANTMDSVRFDGYRPDEWTTQAARALIRDLEAACKPADWSGTVEPYDGPERACNYCLARSIMDNKTAVKLAKALGMTEAEDIHDPREIGQYWQLNGELIRKPQVATDPLESWLNTAEGERAMRNRVRELAGYRGVWYQYEGLGKEHYIVIDYEVQKYYEDMYDTRMSAKRRLEFEANAATERAVWCAALLWLDERKGT